MHCGLQRLTPCSQTLLNKIRKKNSTLIFGQLFFATFWVLSQLAIPRLMVDIIDYGIMVNDMNEIVNRGMLMLLAIVVNIVSLLISLYFLTRVTAGISMVQMGNFFRQAGEGLDFYIAKCRQSFGWTETKNFHCPRADQRDRFLCF